MGVSGLGEAMVADGFGDGGDGPSKLFELLEWFGRDQISNSLLVINSLKKSSLKRHRAKHDREQAPTLQTESTS